MTPAHALSWVRGIHTTIYLLMASAVFAMLYGAISGAHGPWLWLAISLVALEATVFGASGLRCPLTAVAAHYGAARAGVADTFLPERFTRHTLHVFGPLTALAVFLLVARGWWVGWS